MIRPTCAVLGSILLLTPAPPAPASSDVDAVAFVLAFRARAADQYKDKRISGTGLNFHGAVPERRADGTTRVSLVLTLGAEPEAGKYTVLKTWEEFVEAERARTTLVVALTGDGLPEPPASGHPSYEFSGVYDGQVRTIMRAPQAASSDVPDPGPCAGEHAVDKEKPGRFYCAPLLTAAVATLKTPGDGPDRR